MKSNTMITVKFRATIGVVAGYGHENTGINESTVMETWIQKAEEQMTKTGIFVSAVATPAKALYSHNWGCPQGGEAVFVFEGSLNTSFKPAEIEIGEYAAAWQKAVLNIVEMVSGEFQQSTSTLEFMDETLLYLIK